MTRSCDGYARTVLNATSRTSKHTLAGGLGAVCRGICCLLCGDSCECDCDERASSRLIAVTRVKFVRQLLGRRSIDATTVIQGSDREGLFRVIVRSGVLIPMLIGSLLAYR